MITGVEILVLDALRHREHATHMSVAEAIETSDAIHPGRTLFTHLCHELAHADCEADLPDNIRVAFDGLKITP